MNLPRAAKQVVKRIARRLGVEVHRARDPALPFVRQIEYDGRSFYFWIANPHTKAWWDKPILRDNAERRSLKRMSAAGTITFDVGAHHGMESLQLANWVGTEGRVYAFEPSPENALVLDANLGINGITNCVTVHTAVGAGRGEVAFSDESVSMATASRRIVPLISLDDFCRAEGIESVHLIKIDVEGFEGEVLKGARRTLASLPNLAIELHTDELGHYGWSVASVFSLLDLDQYECSMMTRPDWDTLTPFSAIEDLPHHGVTNVFLSRRTGRM